MSVSAIGVVGTGVIGTGVVQALAETGHRVVAVDVSAAILDKSRKAIVESLRLQRLFRKKPNRSTEETLANISWTTETGALANAGFVIENVTEKWDVKQRIYAMLEAICGTDAVLAANTSAIPITSLAALVTAPDRVLGLHFMNPVPLRPAVEVICGQHTSTATLARARSLLAAMGKEGIIVKDSPGFVANRVLMLAVNEAIRLVQEAVAPPEDVDRIFTACIGHTMGPLATADLIGLETVLLSLEVLQEHFGDGRFAPCALLVQMVNDGRLGCKTGQGFYTYQLSGEA
jgi:3-hydroxybutyryl-CoA dehydrogenase